MRLIFELQDYRVTEVEDTDVCMDDLKGDCYEPQVNPDIDADQLRREEIEFENMVNKEGVYGYVLEKWNPEVGQGWEHVDSCFGFVGQHQMSNEHYIVEELCNQAKGGAK